MDKYLKAGYAIIALITLIFFGVALFLGAAYIVDFFTGCGIPEWIFTFAQACVGSSEILQKIFEGMFVVGLCAWGAIALIGCLTIIAIVNREY